MSNVLQGVQIDDWLGSVGLQLRCKLTLMFSLDATFRNSLNLIKQHKSQGISQNPIL